MAFCRLRTKNLSYKSGGKVGVVEVRWGGRGLILLLSLVI